jgi:hypothetical protein
MGKEMTNRAKNKSDAAKRTEFGKRCIVHDLADLESTPRSGVELSEKRREPSTESTAGDTLFAAWKTRKKVKSPFVIELSAGMKFQEEQKGKKLS